MTPATSTLGETARKDARPPVPHSVMWRQYVPYFYIGVALPTALILCFLTPPLQSEDEGRHFLRACQFAEGRIISEFESNTHAAGGWLPAAAADFVREKMTPEYFRKEDELRSIGERLRAFDRAAQTQRPISERRFAAFPTATIYPPSLYLPQATAIAVARRFSDKVYVWFYAARLFNAIVAVVVIFVALRLAPAYQLWLIVPAALPISLYQISSVSSDAGIISLSILLVALSLRFVELDGARIRAALIGCLFLLTTGKPVHLAFAPLLLGAHKRLGWRRAASFCAAAIAAALGGYIMWSCIVRDFVSLAGADFPGHNPSAQVHFIILHPIQFASVLVRTLRADCFLLMLETIGFFGWTELPLPAWFYKATACLFAAMLLLIVWNWKATDRSQRLLGLLSGIMLAAFIVVASFVLWTPVGAPEIARMTGRYFVPVLALLAVAAPPVNRLGKSAQTALAVVALGFVVLSAATTVRITKHYFFPDSKLLGKNIHEAAMESRRSCPASFSMISKSWFSSYAKGRADAPGGFRVFVTDEAGTILGESDPALSGSEFLYNLIGSKSRPWFVHFWTPNRSGTLHYWLMIGKDACRFGPSVKVGPYQIPEA